MRAGARKAAAQPRAVDDRNSDEKLRPLVFGSFASPPLAVAWYVAAGAGAMASFLQIGGPERGRTLPA